MVSVTTATEATTTPTAPTTVSPRSALSNSATGAALAPAHGALPRLARLAPWAILLGVLTSLSRFPFRSHYLFSWDSANFALALDQYNVTFHQPQPPGYPLYVASAWL